ncbi:MAG: KpsF/GutQ family sugar-phosphate isomerase [Nevskiales bacterium]
MTTLDPAQLKTIGQRVLEAEAQSVTELMARVDDAFVAGCQLLFDCRGRIVVTGMGKSGHIGGKIAATLASTGSPAFFVHPGEASHGDLGMITGPDVVIALSNSGETAEVLTILPLIKRMGVPLLALTGRDDSTLAKAADVHINVGVTREACPLDLAPTSSTTAALAMGDALAVALLESRGFKEEDFALSHPGGALGRRLLLHVADVMHSGDKTPRVQADASLREALLEMSAKGLGMTTVVDADGKLAGVFTDGDLRRTLDQDIDVRSASIAEVMTSPCRSVGADMLASEALHLMETNKINGLPVVDSSQQVIGAFNMHDLLRAGVV